MTSLFKFSGSPSEISIKLEGEENRRNVEMKGERGEQELCPVYYDGESVSGRVDMRLKDGRKFQHDGIGIELIGNIGKNTCAKGWKNPNGSELFYDKKNH